MIFDKNIFIVVIILLLIIYKKKNVDVEEVKYIIIKITEYEDGGDGCLPIILGGLFVLICFVMSFVAWLGIPNIFASDNPEDKKAIILYLVDLFTSLIIYSGYIYAYKNSMKRFSNCYGTDAAIGLFVFATIVWYAVYVQWRKNNRYRFTGCGLRHKIAIYKNK